LRGELVERGDRAPVATFYAPDLSPEADEVSLGESAARHAGVRRLSAGNEVRLTNGAGAVGLGTIRRLTTREVVAVVRAVERIPRLPLLELLAPVADRDRMLWLAEKCAELGVSVWQPVLFTRSHSVVPRGEGKAFAAKVRARMVGALEQSGGAWLPEARHELPLERALATVTARARYVLDPLGGRIDPAGAGGGAAVIIGPEGGIEPEEHALLHASGWSRVALAPTTLRFETAGIAAVAVLRAGTITVNREE
jgi:16S rRNA (uracil1498-N3)-methyltransferase